MKIAFLTTVFEANKDFLFDFFTSLKNQTYNKFDLIIVNDGYDGFHEIKLVFSKYINIIELKYSNTPIKNREYGINYCIENNYEIIIFGDSDDYFENNRVDKSISLLNKYDIVVNELNLFYENGFTVEKYFSKRIKNNDLIKFEFVIDKNIFGLSNTAIKLNDIRNLSLPDNLIAVDWYIFSLLLMNGKKAVFTNETVSYYRQHEQNIIGLKKHDRNSLNKVVKVKHNHYKALNSIQAIFDFELKRLTSVNYTKIEQIDYPLWWEII